MGAWLVSVVDDDASLRRSVRNLLSSAGLRVETFGSAEAFLASDHVADTGCVVVDLRMPGMSGFDLIDRLDERAVRVPVIVLTAHDDATARRQAYDAGAAGFLGKPFHGDVLLEAIRNALKRR